MELRPYQQQAIQAILDARERKVTRQLLVLATGLGKTVIMGGLIHRLGFPKTFGFMHREELINQSVKKIRAFDEQVRIGIEKAADRVDLEKDTIALASVQTVGRVNRKRLSRFSPDWPSIIWVDEAHHAPADSYQQVIEHFGVFGQDPKRDRLFLGTTATPDRLDKKLYANIFDDVVYRYGLREGIHDGWLADIKAFRMEADLDLSKVKVRMGDFVGKDLAKAIIRSNMDEVAVKTWKEKCLGKKSIFFCVDKAHAARFVSSITAAGARADMVVDDTQKEDRERILSQFEGNGLDALVNVGVLTEGFDCESIQCVHILKPTKSKTVYTQMIGRGTRKIPGFKESVDVFDYTRQDHDICSIGTIFGLPTKWRMKGQSMLADVEQLELMESELKVQAEHAESLEDVIEKLLQRRMRLLVDGITDSGLSSDLAWLRPSRNEEKWVIAWENETWDSFHGETNSHTRKMLLKHKLLGAAERFEIFKNEIGHYEAQWIAVSPHGTKKMKILTNPSCAKLVEEMEKKIYWGRSHQFERLRKNAPWRRESASYGEKVRLGEMGVPTWVLPKLSSGDAYSLLQCPPGVVRMMFKDIEKPPERPMAVIT